MGKLALALEAPYQDPRRKCGLGEWIKTLDPDDAETAIEAVDDPKKWPAGTLVIRFRTAGFPNGVNVISVHRRGQCACNDAA